VDDLTRRVAETFAAYWPEMAIYNEDQADGFVEPSFYIHRTGLTIKPAYFGYQDRRYSFQVIYFPGDVDPHTKMDQMTEQWAAIETIPRFAHFKGVGITPDYTENTLQMTFDIMIHAKPVVDITKQNTLDYNGGLTHE
jgi:hypothetical protein